MGIGQRLGNCCQVHWQGLFYLFSLLILLPLIVLDPIIKWRTIFLILWSLIWYIVEPVHLAAIGIIPIIFIPVLGILGSNTICMCFARDTNMLFLLCNFIAATMQHSNAVKRYAYFVLAKLSRNPRKILVIIMIFAYILTAFLPASFVCALMMPTIRALLQYLDEANICKSVNAEIVLKDDENPYPSKVAIAFYTGVAYAANIGSIALPLSSDSGLALRELIKNETDLAHLDDNSFYLKYLMFSLPVSLVLLIVTAIYLEIIFLGFKRPESKAAQEITFDQNTSKVTVAELATKLPALNAHMVCVAVLFVCSMIGVIVCSLLAPEVNDKALKYSLNAMLLCFFYFVLPRNFDFCNYFRCSAPKEFKTAPSVLPWGPVNKLTPWSTFFVHGSSVALGYAIKHTELHMFVGDGLLNVKNRVAQQTGFVALTMLTTVIASNNFVADVMLNMGLKAVGGNTVESMLYTISWSCCLTFLLPVSSSANCFAMGWGNVRAKDMMLAAICPTVVGFLLAVVGGIIMNAIA